MLKVKIPTALKTDKAGYSFIAELYPLLVSQEDKEVTIDFSVCLDIDANLAAAIGAILDRLVDEGFQIWLNRPVDKKVRTVLSRNHFLKAWNVPTQTEDRENYVEYRKFQSIDSAAFKQYIDDGLIKKEKFPKHTNLVGSNIIENIYEIYANAIMHGETTYVYSCGEYNEKEHILEMTIVDCGKTIPLNVNNYLSKKNLPTYSHCDAIKWAFISGNTTKDVPGGLGLAILKDFINLNGGAIQVVSGRGMIEYSGNNVEQYLLEVEFPGTIVNMRFNFDDSKNYYMTCERETINLNDLL